MQDKEEDSRIRVSAAKELAAMKKLLMDIKFDSGAYKKDLGKAEVKHILTLEDILSAQYGEGNQRTDRKIADGAHEAFRDDPISLGANPKALQSRQKLEERHTESTPDVAVKLLNSPAVHPVSAT